MRYGAPDLSTAEMTQLQEVLVDSGALDRAEAEIGRLVEAAVAALVDVPLLRDGKARLEELAAFVARRAH
jgi:geranylgeranyl pyrophosphate synthase